MSLLAEAGLPVPPPERPALHRFRNLVADLGTDLYLATIDERVVGVVHVTYARQLAAAPQATLAALLVVQPARRCGVGTTLLRFAAERAQQRSCTSLQCPLPAATDAGAKQFLLQAGAAAAGELLALPLANAA